MNNFNELLMEQALEQAALAYSKGEVPVGAVIADKSGQVIAKAHNLVESSHTATAHAEILAIQEATSLINDWRLNDCTLCVTLEPCLMCAGAITLSRFSKVIFGANEPETGAFGSKYNIAADNKLANIPEIVGGVMAEECREIVQRFFRERRKKPI